MSKLNNIVQSFQFENCYAFLCSLFPSVKYKATVKLLVLSTTLTTIAELMGLKTLTIVAFIVLCVLELVSGVYASVFIQKEKLQSIKASRFTIKLASIMIVFFVLNTFYLQYKDSNNLASTFFEWLYLFVFCWFALEYLVSVIENIGKIYGQSTNKLVIAIKGKFNKIFDIEDTPTNEAN